MSGDGTELRCESVFPSICSLSYTITSLVHLRQGEINFSGCSVLEPTHNRELVITFNFYACPLLTVD